MWKTDEIDSNDLQKLIDRDKVDQSIVEYRMASLIKYQMNGSQTLIVSQYVATGGIRIQSLEEV